MYSCTRYLLHGRLVRCFPPRSRPRPDIPSGERSWPARRLVLAASAFETINRERFARAVQAGRDEDGQVPLQGSPPATAALVHTKPHTYERRAGGSASTRSAVLRKQLGQHHERRRSSPRTTARRAGCRGKSATRGARPTARKATGRRSAPAGRIPSSARSDRYPRSGPCVEGPGK